LSTPTSQPARQTNTRLKNQNKIHIIIMAPPDKQAAATMMMLLLYYISVILSVQAKTSPAEEEKIFSCINIRKILQCSILLLQLILQHSV
jgi:VanZ family protein